MKTNAKTNQNTILTIPQTTNENKPRAKRGRPPKAGKTTVINGGKFTNCFNEVTIETPLESLDKWELRRLYQNNESVQDMAKKKFQLEYLKEFENYIYRNISNLIQAVESDIKKGYLCNEKKSALQLKEDALDENGKVRDLFSIEASLLYVGNIIEGCLDCKSDKDIQKYFTNNVNDVFDTDKYVVDKDYNVYEKLIKLFA